MIVYYQFYKETLILRKSKRQELIYEIILERGDSSVAELANHFDVSEITIRRDLDDLQEQGLIKRGVVGVDIQDQDERIPVIKRINEECIFKKNIAKKAVELIGDSTTIFLGSGSTTACMVPYIISKNNFTVVTNAINIGYELARGEDLSIVVIGGLLRKSELSLIGHISEQALSELRVDKVFMGIKAIDLIYGLTNDYLPEVVTDRKIFSMNTETIILADHTKFGKVSSAFVAPINQVSILITDEKTDPEILHGIQKQGVEVIVVDAVNDLVLG